MTDIADKRIVSKVPGMERVVVRRDLPYKTAGSETLGFDIYTPEGSDGTTRPAVIFISGYADPGFEKMVGCRFKELGAYVSWAQLLACMGLVAITYQNTQPEEDAADILQFITENAESYGINAAKLALWSCSGNVPCALNLLCETPELLACAVFSYGYLLDLDGYTGVADACTAFRFVNATAGKSVTDIGNVPFLLVRAGNDEMPALNETADRFVTHALAAGLPLTLINYAAGVHAFDIEDDSQQSKRIIRQILDYLRLHLIDSGS